MTKQPLPESGLHHTQRIPGAIVASPKAVEAIIRAAGCEPETFPRRRVLEEMLSNALWLRRRYEINPLASHSATRDGLTKVEKAANALLAAVGLPHSPPDLSKIGIIRHAANRDIVDFGLLPAATLEVKTPSVPGVGFSHYTPRLALEKQLVSEALVSVYRLREWARRGALIQSAAAQRQIGSTLRKFDPHADTRDQKDTGDGELNDLIESLCRIWTFVFEGDLGAERKPRKVLNGFVRAALAALDVLVPHRPQKRAKRTPKLKLGEDSKRVVTYRRQAAQAETFRKRVSKAATKIRKEQEKLAAKNSS